MKPEMLIGNSYREFIAGNWQWYIDYAFLQPNGKISQTCIAGKTETEVIEKMKEIAGIYTEVQQ